MTAVSVPFLDLITPHRELENELVEAFRLAVRSAAFVGGPEVDAFEREFAAYCGTRHCVGVANGTDAVRFALIAAGIGSSDAVLTVANTFIATTEAISQAGADSEFVDVDEQSLCLDPVQLDLYLAACARDPRSGLPVGRRTAKPIKAVVPVHLYGQVADVEAIGQVAATHGILMIEDACQAHGAAARMSDGSWRRAGSFGVAAAFSFYPGKNLGACGEAGAVTTDDERIADVVRKLRDHGQATKYFHDLEGYNGRLDAIQAAFLRIKLRHLDEWNSNRRRAADRYAQLLARSSTIVLPVEPDTRRSVYHLYVVRCLDRDGLAGHLRAAGVHTGLHYPLPLHLQHCYRKWGYRSGDLRVTESAASQGLSLPMFPGITLEQQERLATAIAEFEMKPGLKSASPTTL